MTSASLPVQPRPTGAVALLGRDEPMPPAWCTDSSRPACDLCSQPNEQLWPLATDPGVAELPAGELLICRSCADAIRPPRAHHTAAVRTTKSTNSKLTARTVSESAPISTLT